MKYRSILLPLALLFSLYVYPQNNSKQITLEDIWKNYTFSQKSPREITSMKDGEHYCVLEDGSVNMYSYKTGEKMKTIFDESTFNDEINKSPNHQITKSPSLNLDSYDFSPDESKILITTNTQMIYRYSFTASFYIWDIKLEKLIPLSDKKLQRLATFSPDGSKIAFVFENNIYIKNIKSGIEEQITTDGKDGSIINGSTDWVYGEELDIIKAFEWSPDGTKLAYYHCDETNVPEYSFPVYGELYPENYKYKYPKSGENNSVIQIYVYDLNGKSAKIMDIGNNTDIYIPRIKWTPNASLSILRLNRMQNKLEILLADAATAASKVIYTEENKYYINITDNLTFLKNNKGFLLTSESSGYNHIYFFDMNGKLINAVTNGNWDVDDFLGIDEKNDIVFYTSSEQSPLERDVYSIKLNGESKKKLSSQKGTNKAEFSSTFKYFILTHSDANTPLSTSVCRNDGKELRMLESNFGLIQKMKDYNFSKKELFSFKTSDGTELNGWMIKPVDFNSNLKYPVLMDVYGGPASQTVRDAWGGSDYVWDQMLAQKGYISVSVDNRGTGSRGEEFRKCTYLQLGRFETDDQIEAAKYIASLPYVDAKRIGIWGWSYGGFMTTLCLTKGSDYFKTGIAVAPVTNWRYYDNIYTERFMRTPQENQMGYDDNSPVKYADRLKGKLLIIHGLADDNVHFQNSAEFISALIKDNKQFETFLYPNKNHFLNGGTTRLHLYTMMTNYIFKNL